MTSVLAFVGLGGALAVRLGLAGPARAQSGVAGLAFGVVLLAVVALLGGTPLRLSRATSAAGVAGGIVVCLPVAVCLRGDVGAVAPAGLFPRWVAIVVVVAVAEELLLRGVAFTALRRWQGSATAVVVTAVAFALLHVPLYGWQVMPLDFAVGIWLGVLRIVASSVSAPAIAHTVADVLGWWLR